MNWKRLLSGKRTVTSEPEMRIYFHPLDDITVKELAYVVLHKSGLGALQDGMTITYEQWGKVPNNVKRHFTKFVPKDPWVPK